MGGPEYLENRPPPRGRRTWAVAAVVVLVVAALTVVRLQQPTVPAPGPEPPSAGASAPGRSWPVGAGLPSGTLFVAAAGRLHAIDVGSGLLSSARIAMDPVQQVLVPIATGVLVLPHDGSTRQLLFVYGSPGYVVRGLLRSGTSFRPASDDTVWAARLDPDVPAETNTWRRVDADGRVSAAVPVTGVAQDDGDGGLLEVGSQGVRRV